MGVNDSVTINVNVKNTGNYDGDEVVQLYVKNLSFSKVSNSGKAIKDLRGFKRVYIKKGETKQVQITLKAESLKYFNDKKDDMTVEPGNYEIQIGASSEDIRLKDNLKIE